MLKTFSNICIIGAKKSVIWITKKNTENLPKPLQYCWKISKKWTNYRKVGCKSNKRSSFESIESTPINDWPEYMENYKCRVQLMFYEIHESKQSNVETCVHDSNSPSSFRVEHSRSVSHIHNRISPQWTKIDTTFPRTRISLNFVDRSWTILQFNSIIDQIQIIIDNSIFVPRNNSPQVLLG